MDSIGTRIRNLRKKRKLTLEALAGQQMTKGMLSLIENDKSKPSMESLTHIAAKLNVGVNELLENISTVEVRELLNEIKKAFHEEEYDTVVNQLKNVAIEDLPLAYESGKLLEVYNKACYFTGKKEWREIWQRADDIFMTLKLYNHSAKLNHFLVWTEMNKFHYETALELLMEKKEALKYEQAELDIIVELDFKWNEIILLFSIDKYDEASKKLQEAISLSKERNVYYRIEELYRLAYFYAMMNDKEEDMGFYLGKLSLLADFTESENAKSNVLALRIHYYNSYLKEYDLAIELIDKFYSLYGEDLKYFYVMEKGKALFGKQKYELALNYLLEFEEVTDWNHPFDLSLMYEVHAYIARCYLKLNDVSKANGYAKYAVDKVDHFPETPSKKFIDETMYLVNKGK
ncbi:helix-turn-helix domain-containing protein [Virgibacillus siamensis]|uniref:helix-turn-helix domain-containing protein n=1 Tax=Virgibacillus siamensis TaxID=480071 RepID=UPI000984E21B|nr:helix-turn-helix transcriptional regulator [Virgibacillus siamensis]